MIKVFLASSSKYRFGKKNNTEYGKALKNIIEQIEKQMAAEGLTEVVSITPWWDCLSFKTAGDFIDSLIDVVHEYNLGIFVLGKDIESQKSDDYFPNNNVMIEVGMFKVMRKKTFIIEDGNIIKPSDLNASQSVKFSETANIVRGFIATTKTIINEKTIWQQNETCVYYNYELPLQIMNFNNNTADLQRWCTKALFVGSKSAYLWGKREISAPYDEELVIEDFAQRNTFSSACANIDNIISFGPGAGKIDCKLVEVCEQVQPKICYIPIDINAYLIIRSAQKISGMGKQIPFAILDDFEKNECYTRLATLVEMNKNKIGKNNLFSMLGVTFSNLTMDCNTFCGNMKKVMKDANDHLFLDVIIYDDTNGGFKDEKELREKIDEQIDIYWELIKNSIKRKGLCEDCDNLDYRNLKIELNTPPKLNVYTKIPETKILSVSYNNNILFIAKYYQYEKIKQFFGRHFTIVDSEIYPESLRGVFLLKKKTNSTNYPRKKGNAYNRRKSSLRKQHSHFNH
jgi:hypothetical protein